MHPSQLGRHLTMARRRRPPPPVEQHQNPMLRQKNLPSFFPRRRSRSSRQVREDQCKVRFPLHLRGLQHQQRHLAQAPPSHQRYHLQTQSSLQSRRCRGSRSRCPVCLSRPLPVPSRPLRSNSRLAMVRPRTTTMTVSQAWVASSWESSDILATRFLQNNLKRQSWCNHTLQHLHAHTRYPIPHSLAIRSLMLHSLIDYRMVRSSDDVCHKNNFCIDSRS